MVDLRTPSSLSSRINTVVIETGTVSDGSVSSSAVGPKQLTSAIPPFSTMLLSSQVNERLIVKENTVGEQEQRSFVPGICAFTPDTAIDRAKTATCTHLSIQEYPVAPRLRGTDPLIAIPGDSRADIVPLVCSSFYQRKAMKASQQTCCEVRSRKV